MSARRPATRRQNSGRGHTYLLDGEKVPGVTTILSAGIPKPALVGWAANQTAEFVANRLDLTDGADGQLVLDAGPVLDALRHTARPSDARNLDLTDGVPRLAIARALAGVRWSTLRTASARGTDVHRWAEALAAGEDVHPPEEHRPIVEQAARFLDDWDLTDADIEAVVVSRRWRYMGTRDLTATARDGTRWLFDYKTSASGIWPETVLQLAAYDRAELTVDDNGVEHPNEPCERHAAVWLRSDGYDVVPLAADDRAFRVFLWAKGVGDWLADADPRDGDSDIIGAPINPPTGDTDR